MRIRAAKALGGFNDPRSIQALVDLLDDQDTKVRMSSALCLGRIGLPAHPVLIELLKKGGERAQLITIALNENWEPASAALKAEFEAIMLERRRSPNSIGQESNSIAANFIKALGWLKCADASNLLEEALTDQSWLVRTKSLDALYLILGVGAAQLARQALEDDNCKVRLDAFSILKKAIKSLGFRQTAEGMPFLMESLGDGNTEIQSQAADSIYEIAKKEAVDLAQVKRILDGNIRRAAMKNDPAHLRSMRMSMANQYLAISEMVRRRGTRFTKTDILLEGMPKPPGKSGGGSMFRHAQMRLAR